MRIPLLVAAVSVAALGLSGCESDEAADPVPTMSVRPDGAATPTETATGFEVSPEETQSSSEEATAEETSSEPTTSGPEPSNSAPPATTSAAPASPDLGRAPTSYPEAVAYVDLARSRGGSEQRQFFATDEDIYCVLDSQWLDPTCELPQGVGIEDPQACRDAMGDRVGRIEVRSRGPVAACNTDTIREAVPEVVAPVAVVSHSGFSCAVADIGVTCTGDGVGFFLGLDSYAVFG